MILPLINKEYYLLNSKSRIMLGLVYDRDIRETIKEMGYSLIKFKFIDDKINLDW